MRKLNWENRGIKKVNSKEERLAEIYQDKTSNPYGLLENEYLIVEESGKVLDQMKWQDGKFKQVIPKTIEDDIHGKIKSKNIEQECALDMLLDEKTTVKMLTGTWGSGKSFLSLVSAFHAILKQGRFNKLVFIRNNVELKDSNPIGHLKGTYYDKMAPWAGILVDYLGGVDQLENFINREIIDIQHLGFIRGRSFSNSIVFSTESENLTREHVQLLLGRIGEGSILILEGDCRQTDAKAFEKDSGMEAAIKCLSGNKLFAYIHLEESVRSETAKLADLLDVERT